MMDNRASRAARHSMFAGQIADVNTQLGELRIVFEGLVARQQQLLGSASITPEQQARLRTLFVGIQNDIATITARMHQPSSEQVALASTEVALLDHRSRDITDTLSALAEEIEAQEPGHENRLQ